MNFSTALNLSLAFLKVWVSCSHSAGSPKKTYWLLVLLIGVVGSIVNASSLLHRYLKHDSVTSRTTRTELAATFPAVTGDCFNSGLTIFHQAEWNRKMVEHCGNVHVSWRRPTGTTLLMWNCLEFGSATREQLTLEMNLSSIRKKPSCTVWRDSRTNTTELSLI